MENKNNPLQNSFSKRQSKDNVKKKKHNTALTTRESWQEVLKSGLLTTQKRIILKYLKDQTEPKTSREIWKALDIERSSVTKVLNDFVRDNILIIKKIDKCKTSGRKVQHYGTDL